MLGRNETVHGPCGLHRDEPELARDFNSILWRGMHRGPVTDRFLVALEMLSPCEFEAS